MSSFFSRPVRFSMMVLLGALLVSGCSGSNDSRETVSTDTPSGLDDDPTGTGATSGVSNSGTSDPVVSDPVVSDPVVSDPVVSDPVVSDPVVSDPVVSNPVVSDPVVSDPVISDPVEQTTTRVVFDITVPAYVSDALQVRLIWGEKDLTAMWVGDEFWTVSGDFKTSTEKRLTVTFYDDNGGIVLASFEDIFKTGVQPSESYQITSDQFDSKLWDEDGDGVSNIDELIAGSDPSIIEEERLEIIEPSIWTYFFIQSISGKFESKIPSQRPYFEHTEETPGDFIRPYSVKIQTIELDEFGTGTFLDTADFYHGDTYGNSDVGTRTNTGDSITWMGSFGNYENDAGHSEKQTFQTETRFIDDLTREQIGSVEGSSCCAAVRASWSHSYELTGTVIENTTECTPIAGTVIRESTNTANGSTFTSVTTKSVSDRYWKVVETADGVVQGEFLIPSLARNFYCDFGELE